jgi:hypothetical protein
MFMAWILIVQESGLRSSSFIVGLMVNDLWFTVYSSRITVGWLMVVGSSVNCHPSSVNLFGYNVLPGRLVNGLFGFWFIVIDFSLLTLHFIHPFIFFSDHDTNIRHTLVLCNT